MNNSRPTSGDLRRIPAIVLRVPPTAAEIMGMPVLQPRGWLLAIALGISLVCLYFCALGQRSLWLPDEGRYGEIAREMVAGGDYLTPRLSGARFFEKPPLWYWACAFSMRALGQSEWAARLPCALAGLLCVLAIGTLGARLGGRRVGFLAAVILATAPLHYGLSQFLVLDSGLTLMVTLALATALATWHRAEDHLGPEAIAIALALGTLIKGPVAIVLFGMVAAAWAVLLGAPAWLSPPGSSRRQTLARVGRAITIGLGLTFPWFGAIVSEHPEFAHFFFVREHLDRYLTDTYRHSGPVWYFVPVLLGGMFPWVCFLPWAAGVALGDAPTSSEEAPRRIARERGAIADLQRDDSRIRLARAAAAWLLCPVLFFSLSGSKLPPYVAPALPGLALFLATGIDALIADARRQARRAGALMAGAAAIALTAAALGAATAAVPPDCPDLKGSQGRIVVALACLAMVATLSASLLGAGRPRAAIAALGAVAISLLIVLQVVAIGLDPHRDLRPMCETIRRHRQPGEPVIIIGTIQSASSVPFYLGEPVRLASFVVSELSFAQESLEPDEHPIFLDYGAIDAMLRSRAAPHLFIASPSLFDRLDGLPGMTLRPLAQGAGCVLFENACVATARPNLGSSLRYAALTSRKPSLALGACGHGGPACGAGWRDCRQFLGNTAACAIQGAPAGSASRAH